MFRRQTRVLFDSAFQPGGRRPTAEEWRDHLDALVERLVPCGAKPEEHAHFGSGCGFCAHEARMAAAKARPRAPRDPLPVRHEPVQRRPLAMAAPPRPLPRPVMLSLPPPRRRGGGGWAAVAGMALCAVALYAAQDIWRPVLRDIAGSARAAEMVSPGPSPDAAVTAFTDPQGYRVLPAVGRAVGAAAAGPGEEFAEVARLDLHDDVIATGKSTSADGTLWLWVMRDRDGAIGFVSEAAVRPRAPSNTASEEPSEETSAERMLDSRARAMLAGRGTHDEAYLAEIQRMWEAERRRCDDVPNSAKCRESLLKARELEARGWRQSAAAAAASAPADAVTPASYDSLR
ncbi:MAG: hypothetical protein WDN24_14390 [Sphingomonas sp.]